ncbi:hypothetical protein AYI69_g1789 [Smittium culicis]|uniref:Potassium channel domain-containing protein n=1 Tax=Smittium culicis TaxID=133412 RepID=A0A1R1YP90_9FUNG|nr:hypothetical protein AYI69_g1789 [Smittium culicis]
MIFIHRVFPNHSLNDSDDNQTNSLKNPKINDPVLSPDNKNSSNNNDICSISTPENTSNQRLSKSEKADYPQETNYNYASANNSKSNPYAHHSNDDIPNNSLNENLDINQINSLADVNDLYTNKLKNLSFGNSIRKSNSAEQIDSRNMNDPHNTFNDDFDHMNNSGFENNEGSEHRPEHTNPSFKNEILYKVKKLENFYDDIKGKVMIYLAVFNVINLVVNASIFYSFEKSQWTFYDAVWFCFISFTTIGYGDRTPVKSVSYTYFAFIILFSVSTFSTLLVLIVDRLNTYSNEKLKALLNKFS